MAFLSLGACFFSSPARIVPRLLRTQPCSQIPFISSVNFHEKTYLLIPYSSYIPKYTTGTYLKTRDAKEMSGVATPADATRSGPLPANIPRDSEHDQPSGIKNQEENSKILSMKFNIVYINRFVTYRSSVAK